MRRHREEEDEDEEKGALTVGGGAVLAVREVPDVPRRRVGLRGQAGEAVLVLRVVKLSLVDRGFGCWGRGAALDSEVLTSLIDAGL